ncbi:MAG: hypothetical protein ABIR28_15095 [Vicinamibacteria bacterium]
MFATSKNRTLDGNNPTLICGYGGFNIATTADLYAFIMFNLGVTPRS